METNSDDEKSEEVPSFMLLPEGDEGAEAIEPKSISDTHQFKPVLNVQRLQSMIKKELNQTVRASYKNRRRDLNY